MIDLTANRVKSAFLDKFVRQYPGVVSRMRSTLHSFDDDSPNPYHLEDDVWAHTMLVFNNVRLDHEGVSDTDKAALVAAICHDYGKIFTRASHKPSKINFWGHAEKSTLFTAECTNFMYGNDPKFNRILHLACFAVSQHINAYDMTHENVWFYNGDPEMAIVMENLLVADCLGQFCHVDGHNKKNEDLFKQIDVTYRNCYTADHSQFQTPRIWLYCGTPGSGKDYLAKQAGHHIISFDAIRVKKYLEAVGPQTGKSEKDVYMAAFEWMRSHKDIDLLGEVAKEIIEVPKEKTIAICNTNCTIDARKSVRHAIRKVVMDSIGCIMILAPLQNAIHNDKTRSDKNVGAEIVRKFAGELSIPTMIEGFSEVTVIFNGHKN